METIESTGKIYEEEIYDAFPEEREIILEIKRANEELNARMDQLELDLSMLEKRKN